MNKVIRYYKLLKYYLKIKKNYNQFKWDRTLYYVNDDHVMKGIKKITTLHIIIRNMKL